MIQKQKDKIILINEKHFSAKDILECGQIFRYAKNSKGNYEVFSLNKHAEIVEKDGVVEIFCDDVDYFFNFFDFETDYSKIVDELSEYPILKTAIDYGFGIRILNQDLFETIISFIVSANNNIKRIQKIIEKMCSSLGTKTDFGYAFPTLEQLSSASVELLRSFGLGYRAEYIHKTINIMKNFNIDSLKEMSTENARQTLLKLAGVGPKVADCILLFALQKNDVFPCDTWIKKVYHEHFEQGHKDHQISKFFVTKFDKNSGYAQQYLFYFQRKYLQKD